MKLHLHSTVVYRVPKFSYESSLKECWKELKLAIASSSTDFYQSIGTVTADEISQLPEKLQFTIWKYFNRAMYRCVPYGPFASTGIFHLDQHQFPPVMIANKQQLHVFGDWMQETVKLSTAQLVEKDAALFSNTTCYFTTDGIRYLAREGEGFILMDNVKDELVMEVLDRCKVPVKMSVLLAGLKDKADAESVMGLLEEMIELQLLFSSHDRNIIGQDYYQRTGQKIKADAVKYELALQPYLSGSIDKSVFAHVPELSEKLRRILAVKKSEMLSVFVQAFLKKFEGLEIPLMVALDPEMGVGYGALETGITTDEFIGGLAGKREKPAQKDVALEEFFKTKLRQSNGTTIQLEDLKLEATEETDILPLPNTTSALCSIADNLLVMDMFGGATGNALLGRFTLASEEIRTHCLALYQIEAGANPDVIFFDIAYQVGNRIDNVNRRKQIYDHSLSILGFDSNDEPLAIDDVMVSVHQGEVVLRSKQYNKRLIPRFASAYNHSKSDLSLFRLLSDLQYQGLQCFLHFNLSSIFPGFNFYPRVQYRNIVVSTAKWKVQTASVFNKGKKDIHYCRQYLKSIGIGSYFKSGFSDQTLTFCLKEDRDIWAFLLFIEKLITVELEEAILGKTPVIRDEAGHPYYSQFALNYVHEEKIYKGYQQSVVIEKPSLKLPGSEWLYFEIYCHPQRADALIQKCIVPFVSQRTGLIKGWFFVRYHDNGPHLRIRFHLHNALDMQILVADFCNLIKPELESGIVADLLIRTYKRETQRYSMELMERIEAHFCLDSDYVCELLRGAFTCEQYYKQCNHLIQLIGLGTSFDEAAFESLLSRVSESYNKEHHLGAPDFKKLNKSYQDQLPITIPVLDNRQEAAFKLYWKSFLKVLAECPKARRDQLFGDLMHMHVNRLFDANQRTHEMVIYYYAIKDYRTRQAKMKQQSKQVIGQG